MSPQVPTGGREAMGLHYSEQGADEALRLTVALWPQSMEVQSVASEASVGF